MQRVQKIMGHLDGGNQTSAEVAPVSTAAYTDPEVIVLRSLKIAHKLMEARAHGIVLDGADLVVDTIEEANAVHQVMVKNGTLGRHVGWKIGACDVETYTKMGLTEPIRGPLFEHRTFPSPATLKGNAIAPIGRAAAEAEYGFILNKTLGPRISEYSEDEVFEAISEMVLCMEICSTRVKNATTMTKIADSCSNHCVVTGPSLKPVRDLSQHVVKILVNGKEKGSGTGASLLGNPLTCLTWLVNHLAKRNTPLKKGQLCISGAAAKVYTKDGDYIVCDFGSMGEVRAVRKGMHGARR